MPDDKNTKKTVFLEVETLVEQWLESRQSLIIRFCQFSQLQENLPPSLENLNELKDFCAQLVDYISTGHFEIYEKLLKEAQLFGDDNLSLMEEIYPKITDTTDEFVALDAKFDGKNNLSMAEIKTALSSAGQILDKRFMLEDQLIQFFHKSHETEALSLGMALSN